MQVGGAAWDDGRLAWRRLTGDRSRAGSDDGERALEMLSDIGLVRRLLDHAELAAVRTARRGGRSWAEIATNLGITRQSAWERWRDLDEPADAAASAGGADARAAAELVQAASGSVTVPEVIGLSPDDAASVLRRAGLTAAEHNPGGRAFALRPERSGVVVDQVPGPGARRRRGSTVALWLQEGGGSAGVREPRRPRPSPREGAETRDIA